MDYKRSIVVIAGLLFSMLSFAEIKDPTRPAQYSQHNAGFSNNAQFKLSSILISGDYKRAVINGRSAKEGDVIFSTIKVLSISKNSVLIEPKDQEPVKLVLYSISTVEQ